MLLSTLVVVVVEEEEEEVEDVAAQGDVECRKSCLTMRETTMVSSWCLSYSLSWPYLPHHAFIGGHIVPCFQK